MTTTLSAAAEAARRAAAEAARRRAEEAARRAAELAAQKAAEAAAKKAAEAAAKKALVHADEQSTGVGTAIRTRGLTTIGADRPADQLASGARRYSVNDLLNASADGSTLHDEVRGDASENCLERAANLAQPGDSVVLLEDTDDSTGHAVVQRADGSVVDPNTPNDPYASLEAYQQANPNYVSPVTVSDEQLERVLDAPPGAAREALITQLGLSSAAARSVADPRDLTTAQQAEADAVQVQAVYDDAISSGQSEAAAAAAAAGELQRFAEAHDGNSAYMNALVREAAPTLDRIARTLADNTEGRYDSGDDKNAIKDTIKSLARVAEAGGAVTAGMLGRTLASPVDDDSELFQFDDAFYEYKDDGGSNLLFDATTSALRAMGHDDAAGELAERGGDGGFVDAVKDGAGNVVGSIADGFGAVAGFATDLGEGVLHVATEVGEFAVDTVEGTVNLVGDAASWSADQVGNAVQYAVEQGLKLSGAMLDWVREQAQKGIDEGLGITENVESLQPGDTLSVGGEFEAQLGVQVEASAELEVSMETGPDGQPIYTVSGEVEAGVGIGAGATGTAGLGGRMEFTFDNPQDAARAAKILAAGAAGVAALASGPAAVLAPALLPSGDDLEFLHQNLKSVEVSAQVGGEFESAAGVASAEVEGETGYRLDFEDGHPVSMTRVTEVEAEGSLGGPLELLNDNLGNSFGIPLEATASGTLRVETTIPIDGAQVTDIAGFLASPTTAAISGEAETTITVEGDFTAGQAGVHGEVVISDIDASEARQVVGRLLSGDVANAFEGVEVTTAGEASTFHDEGFDFGFEATIAGQGIEAEAHNEVRREDASRSFEVRLG